MGHDKERGFREKILELYRSAASKGSGIDLRPQELQAMFDVFLGQGYDKGKREKVASLQRNLHQQQRELALRLTAGTLDPRGYAKSFNIAFTQMIDECEVVLGPVDFQRLFGSPHKSWRPIIDEETFVKSR